MRHMLLGWEKHMSKTKIPKMIMTFYVFDDEQLQNINIVYSHEKLPYFW
jgi:hypothetical protein